MPSEEIYGTDGYAQKFPIRLVTIRKVPEFNGYGFNLHTDKKINYIGFVDNNSPAQKAGLHLDDRIVEVNGVRIDEAKHSEIVEEIRRNPDQVIFLVATPEVFESYQKRNIRIGSIPDSVKVIDQEIYTQQQDTDCNTKNKDDPGENQAPSSSNIDMPNDQDNILKDCDVNDEEDDLGENQAPSSSNIDMPNDQGDILETSDLSQITIAEVKEKNRRRKLELETQRKKKIDSQLKREILDNL